MRYYYAQNKEDLLIQGFFPDVPKGFYVDVGANDPEHDSVTKLFYDQGWSGINIEPIDRLHKALVEARPRDKNLRIGVGSASGTLEFTEYPDGDGLSTFDDSMSKYYEKGDHHFPTHKLKKYAVDVRTLSQVVKKEKPAQIHFLKIDVEGFEYDVIQGYDWKSLRPELICIEANHISKDWRPILIKNHYEEVFFDGINNYYLAKESLHRRDYFNYADAVFAGNPVYYPAAKELEKPLIEKNDYLTSLAADREQEIFLLQKQQRDVRFLGKRLYSEMQLRIANRSHESRSPEGHKYKSDSSISQALAQRGGSKDELLTFIHERDANNIHLDQQSMKARITPFFWRIVLKILSSSTSIIRKIARI